MDPQVAYELGLQLDCVDAEYDAHMELERLRDEEVHVLFCPGCVEYKLVEKPTDVLPKTCIKCKCVYVEADIKRNLMALIDMKRVLLQSVIGDDFADHEKAAMADWFDAMHTVSRGQEMVNGLPPAELEASDFGLGMNY